MQKTQESIAKKVTHKAQQALRKAFKVKLDENGSEILDPKPLYQEVGFKKPPSIDQKIRQMVQAQMMQVRESMTEDEIEDENDFSDDENFDLVSPYEVEAMAEEFPIEVTESPSDAGVSGDSPTPTTTPDGQENNPEEPLPTK